MPKIPGIIRHTAARAAFIYRRRITQGHRQAAAAVAVVLAAPVAVKICEFVFGTP